MGVSIVIPTRGRETLERTLASVGPLREGDSCTVVVDTYEMDRSEYLHILYNRVKPFGQQFGALSYDAGHHCFGHCQLNMGVDLAWNLTPDNLITFNDDDDIYTPGAIDFVRGLSTDKLHICKFITPWRQILPKGERVFEGGVGGHCIVVPAHSEDRIGKFTCRYNGDWDFIESTVALWANDVEFHDFIIAETRPSNETV